MLMQCLTTADRCKMYLQIACILRIAFTEIKKIANVSRNVEKKR